MIKQEYLDRIISDWQLLQQIAAAENRTVFTVWKWFKYRHAGKILNYRIMRQLAEYYGCQINDLIE